LAGPLSLFASFLAEILEVVEFVSEDGVTGKVARYAGRLLAIDGEE
jgi:hypothetical protein